MIQVSLYLFSGASFDSDQIQISSLLSIQHTALHEL